MSPAIAPGVVGDRSGVRSGEPQWLLTDPEPVFTVLHSPPEAADRNLAVLILPPFGWDNDCSYRRRREWATALADAGITAARIDLPGTEDSGGTALADNLLQHWIRATVDAANWVRERSGCERLTALGIGVGGVIACGAMAAGGRIDDVILWGVRASGRAHVRELRAFAALSGNPGMADAARPDAALGVGGHMMAAQTAAALSALDLTRLELPQASLRRALLIGRDAHGVDTKLSAHLEGAGVSVTALDSDEYSGLLSPPDLALTPHRTIAASIDWLLAGAAAAPIERNRTASPAVPASAAVTLDHGGVRIRERIVQLRTASGRVVGILSEPESGQRSRCCLVTVNSGALRHTGPNRMFVDVARRAAAAGVPAARFDLPGLGDSDGSAIKSFERRAEDEPLTLSAIREIHEQLARDGVAEQFVAGGFSLGGYLTVRMALTEPAPLAAISVNPTGFSWTVKQRQRAVRDFMAMAGPEALAPEPPSRMLPPRLQALTDRLDERRRSWEAAARRRLARSELLWRLEHRRELADLRLGLDRLAGAPTGMLLLLSEGEQLLRMLEVPNVKARLQRCPNISIERLPDHDHLLRPLWIQEIVAERFVSALLEYSRAGSPSETETPVAAPGWKERGVSNDN